VDPWNLRVIPPGSIIPSRPKGNVRSPRINGNDLTGLKLLGFCRFRRAFLGGCNADPDRIIGNRAESRCLYIGHGVVRPVYLQISFALHDSEL
jgi:hypothetical protein